MHQTSAMPEITATGELPQAPFTGWSPLPGQIPPVAEPQLQGPCCPLLPVSCGPCAAGKCVVPAQQPVVPVPVYQEIQKKDRIVEIPRTIVTDKVIPRLYHQKVIYDVPKLDLRFENKPISIPRVEFREKIIDVPVPVGYNFKVVSKWDVREVPKVIPKYVGTQDEIFVEVPQVKIVDKNVEKEVPVYVGEKIVKKLVYQEDPIEVVQYRYVETEEDVPIYRYKPVFDVEVDIPPPLIVPVPVRPVSVQTVTLTREKEIQLQPERLSLEAWKAMYRARTRSPCCAEGGACAQGTTCGGCSVCCHPGGFCSTSGFCGGACGDGVCCASCRGQGCSACCSGDTGATRQASPMGGDRPQSSTY